MYNEISQYSAEPPCFSSFSQVLVPLQSLMTVNLPITVDTKVEHDPFPSNLVYLRCFEDEVQA